MIALLVIAALATAYYLLWRLCKSSKQDEDDYQRWATERREAMTRASRNGHRTSRERVRETIEKGDVHGSN